jgi:hypothetical protein
LFPGGENEFIAAVDTLEVFVLKFHGTPPECPTCAARILRRWVGGGAVGKTSVCRDEEAVRFVWISMAMQPA